MSGLQSVAKGELDSVFAIMRPPSHHAGQGEAMGLCLFNNVAIAARTGDKQNFDC